MDASVTITSDITSVVSAQEKQCPIIIGDLQVSSPGAGCTEVQVEDLKCVALSKSEPQDDYMLFSHVAWVSCISSGVVHDPDSMSGQDIELVEACERMSLFFFQRLRMLITDDAVPADRRPLFMFIDYLLANVEAGKHPTTKKEWLRDDIGTINAISARHSTSVDARLISAVGDKIADVVRGSTTMLEHMLANSMLDQVYMDGIGLRSMNLSLSSGVAQIAHRYPHLNILEIWCRDRKHNRECPFLTQGYVYLLHLYRYLFRVFPAGPRKVSKLGQ
jgi:hypothetical protein